MRILMFARTKIPTFSSLVFLATLAAAFTWSPLIFLLAVCLLSALALDGNFKWVFLLSACLLFCLLNLSKELEGDLVTYVNLQHYLAYRSPFVLFSDELRTISGTYRVTEIGFYGPLWMLSNIFGADGPALPIAVTLAIYVPTFFGLRLIGTVEQWNERLAMVVTIFVFFAALNFTQTTHLIRQYLSGSFAFFAFACLVSGRRSKALIPALLACSFHNGTALLAADFVLFSLLFPFGRFREFRAWELVLRAIFALVAVVISAAAILLHETARPATESNIAPWHYILIGAVFVIFLFCSRARGPQTKTYHYLCLAFLIVYSLSLGFFLLGLNVVAVRYFVYLEWLFGLMIAGILCAVPRSHPIPYAATRWATCSVATLVLMMRIYGAPWTYGPGQAELFTHDLPRVAEFVPR